MANQVKHIKVLQINLQHSKNATNACTNYINENKIDIVLVQEPYILNNRVTGFPLSYQIIQSETDSMPRAAIIIANKNVFVVKLVKNCNRDSVWISIRMNGRDLTLSSIYMSPNANIENDLNNLEDNLQQLKPNFYIIGCDSNAHSILWNSPNTDLRGRLLNDFINCKNLFLLNNGFKPTFWRETGESIIDLTLCNENILRNCNDWHVTDIETLSDHQYKRFRNCKPTKYRRIRNNLF
jgi:hypothetical protein